MSPQVKRESSCHLASAISSDDFEGLSSDADIEVLSTPAKLNSGKPTTHVVSEPKHRHAAKHRAAFTDTTSGVQGYLKVKIKMDHERLDLVKAEKREKQKQAECYTTAETTCPV